MFPKEERGRHAVQVKDLQRSNGIFTKLWAFKGCKESLFAIKRDGIISEDKMPRVKT